MYALEREPTFLIAGVCLRVGCFLFVGRDYYVA